MPCCSIAKSCNDHGQQAKRARAHQRESEVSLGLRYWELYGQIASYTACSTSHIVKLYLFPSVSYFYGVFAVQVCLKLLFVYIYLPFSLVLLDSIVYFHKRNSLFEVCQIMWKTICIAEMEYIECGDWIQLEK